MKLHSRIRESMACHPLSAVRARLPDGAGAKILASGKRIAPPKPLSRCMDLFTFAQSPPTPPRTTNFHSTSNPPRETQSSSFGETTFAHQYRCSARRQFAFPNSPLVSGACSQTQTFDRYLTYLPTEHSVHRQATLQTRAYLLCQLPFSVERVSAIRKDCT
jgi:hypothetical protein